MYRLNLRPQSFTERLDFLQWKSGGERATLARFVEQEMAAEAATAARDAEERREAAELAAIHRDLLTLRRMLREIKAGFDPGQPRDDAGRWTDGSAIQVAGPISAARAAIAAALRVRVRRTEDILAPNGKPIGQPFKNAGDEIRTVTRKEFDVIKDELQKGSRQIDGPKGYEGRAFERPDGTQFGIRSSRKHGETIDIIRGNSKLLGQDMKVHFR